MADKTYNGWTNYETWAVKLWIDNEQGSHEYWRENAQASWQEAARSEMREYPDQTQSDCACNHLANHLKGEHDSQSEHPVFEAANGSVYADLLNAALSEVNWHEIANALLESEQESGTIDGYNSPA